MFSRANKAGTWDVKLGCNPTLSQLAKINRYIGTTHTHRLQENVFHPERYNAMSGLSKLSQPGYTWKVIQKIREMNRVGIVTAEILEDSNSLSRFGVIEFMVDSVVLLQYLGLAKYKRSLMIRKMRMGDHSTNIHPFEISKKGISVLR